MFMGPRNWFQGMNSASLCSLAGRYDNPIPPRFLAPIDFLKIPVLLSTDEAESCRRLGWTGWSTGGNMPDLFCDVRVLYRLTWQGLLSAQLASWWYIINVFNWSSSLKSPTAGSVITLLFYSYTCDVSLILKDFYELYNYIIVLYF